MTIDKRIEKKVERWAIRLDIHDPEWYRRVNPYRLNLQRDSFCVVGQAFGNFHTAADAQRFRRTWFPFWRFRVGPLTPRPFFYWKPEKRHWAEEAWRLQIRARDARPAFDDRARFLRKRMWYTPNVLADREIERV